MVLRSARASSGLRSPLRVDPPAGLSGSFLQHQVRLQGMWRFGLQGGAPNNSFKPKPNRYAIGFGLILALGPTRRK